MTKHEQYMRRCIDLAKLGAGATASNPMVGAVLVFEGRVIGEGYHQEYGRAHAEVNCINSVLPADQQLIEDSTMYVSLEPCAHFGKTPPCADLIIVKKIRKVVIGCGDPFPAVNGKGIERLEASGIDVKSGVLEDACLELNKRFFTFHTRNRPYIILKWAETADHFIGAGKDADRLMISNDYTNRLVHQWRSEEMAIMVGKNTALKDDPSLTTRLWPARGAVRIVADSQLELPASSKLLDGSVPTVVFNSIKDGIYQGVEYLRLNYSTSVADNKGRITGMMDALYKRNITSVLVEGGARLLQSFIDCGIWDEARIITNSRLFVSEGVVAPTLVGGELSDTINLEDDSIRILRNMLPG